jgi:hypothetical protein
MIPGPRTALLNFEAVHRRSEEDARVSGHKVTSGPMLIWLVGQVPENLCVMVSMRIRVLFQIGILLPRSNHCRLTSNDQLGRFHGKLGVSYCLSGTGT